MLYFSTDGCINKSLTYLLSYLLTYFSDVTIWSMVMVMGAARRTH